MFIIHTLTPDTLDWIFSLHLNTDYIIEKRTNIDTKSYLLSSLHAYLHNRMRFFINELECRYLGSNLAPNTYIRLCDLYRWMRNCSPVELPDAIELAKYIPMMYKHFENVTDNITHLKEVHLNMIQACNVINKLKENDYAGCIG